MASFDVDTVNVYRKLVDRLLECAENAKPDKQIEPPLSEAHLGETPWLIQGDDERIVSNLGQQTQFAAVEVAFREKFYNILVWCSLMRDETRH